MNNTIGPHADDVERIRKRVEKRLGKPVKVGIRGQYKDNPPLTLPYGQATRTKDDAVAVRTELKRLGYKSMDRAGLTLAVKLYQAGKRTHPEPSSVTSILGGLTSGAACFAGFTIAKKIYELAVPNFGYVFPTLPPDTKFSPQAEKFFDDLEQIMRPSDETAKKLVRRRNRRG